MYSRFIFGVTFFFSRDASFTSAKVFAVGRKARRENKDKAHSRGEGGQRPRDRDSILESAVKEREKEERRKRDGETEEARKGKAAAP